MSNKIKKRQAESRRRMRRNLQRLSTLTHIIHQPQQPEEHVEIADPGVTTGFAEFPSEPEEGSTIESLSFSALGSSNVVDEYSLDNEGEEFEELDFGELESNLSSNVTRHNMLGDDEMCICDCSDLSINTSMTIILQFIITANLCKSHINSFLKTLHLLLGESCKLAHSVYHFCKYFAFFGKMKKVYYCEEHKRLSGCGCKYCPSSIKKKKFFCWNNIVDNLKSKVANRHYYEKMQYYRTAYCENSNIIGDIYDSNLYKQYIRSMPTKKDCYTFILNWDGVAKFKSSKTQAWPIYLIINELPLEIRFKKENIIYAGLWVGKGKPNPNIIFSVLVKELLQLEKGIKMNDPYGNEIIVRCCCLMATMDLPARASAMLMTSHKGNCGCIYCLNTGRSFGRRFVFPIDRNANTALRTKEAQEQCFSQLRNNTQGRIKGIEGITVFCYLNNWNMSQFCSLDIMHLLEGLYKSFIKLWTKRKYSPTGSPLISSSSWQEYDQLLQKQKITNLFGRPVRSIATEGKYYKASEILIWFLYFYPCLKGFIPDKNYSHFSIFCESLYELLSPRLPWKRVDELEVTLLQWVLDFQSIYGKQYVSMNVHNVSHLCHCTRVFGPLWCSTCFPFECFNKVISRSIKGKYN